MTLYYKNNKATIWQLLARIVAFSIQSLVYLPSLCSQLLLRNMPIFFLYSASSALCLSSRNRSNSKAFRHILPCVAPVCEGMHYHKTGVPWQMNKIFNIAVISFHILANAPEYLYMLYLRLISRLSTCSTLQSQTA